ncbi:MAG TPA: Ig-like domain-containing protein [Candidatus Acidoferrales bacterium]|nr:Ig-like domain-containing protein [Candidatus Acidoferrales bacterium]
MKPKIKLLACLLLVCLVAPLSAMVVDAKPSLTLSLYKNNGYGMGQDMSGLWTINTETSADVVHVEFYLDDQLQQNDTTAPFNWQFNTSNYTIGTHTLTAMAFDATGDNFTAAMQRNFVEDNTSTILILIVVVVVIVFAISGAVAVYRIKKYKK